MKLAIIDVDWLKKGVEGLALNQHLDTGVDLPEEVKLAASMGIAMATEYFIVNARPLDIIIEKAFMAGITTAKNQGYSINGEVCVPSDKVTEGLEKLKKEINERKI